MSDAAARAAVRETAVLPEEEARLISTRLREGTLALDRVNLAAFCGHEAARLVVGWGWQRLKGNEAFCVPAGLRFGAASALRAENGSHPDWIGCLSVQWGFPILTRAAHAAARIASDAVSCGPGRLVGDQLACCTTHYLIHQALHACASWLREPSPHTLLVWRERYRSSGADFYMPVPPYVAIHGVNQNQIDALSLKNQEVAISNSTRMVGEQPIRATVQQALIAWALR